MPYPWFLLFVLADDLEVLMAEVVHEEQQGWIVAAKTYLTQLLGTSIHT
jgi:hypothetical protein